MPLIKKLDPKVSRLIAAGEVIERPASALKELLENSLDAGATAVSVEITGAGKKSLRVSDNGKGMDPEDCRLALERHATSKIDEIEDLSSLGTYGFRGEALYAIAAISRLSLQSAVEGAANGWRISAEGGSLGDSQPAAPARGTTIEIRDLFFNTPARLKFLKSDAYEKSALLAVFEEAALANPTVRWTYKSEGRTVLQLPPEKPLPPGEGFSKRLAAIWGHELSVGLLPLTLERPGVKFWMFASPPGKLNASRNFQAWFINRRPITSRVLQQALYRAYREHRTSERHPVCAAFLELPPSAFDVNVHPGKREVRFKSERELFEMVESLLYGALAKSKQPATLTVSPRAESLFQERSPRYDAGHSAAAQALPLESRPAEAFETLSDGPLWFTPPYRYLGQIEKSYLVFECSGGVFILDQHAAAERILFERYAAELEIGSVAVQQLMLPLPVELPASRLARILDRAPQLARLGFSIAPYGKTTLHILTAPALLNAGELKETVLRLLDSVESPAKTLADMRRHALSTIACKAAVKAHDATTAEGALRLLEDLKDCRDGSSCPHGRRAMLALNRDELARRFQRPGAP